MQRSFTIGDVELAWVEADGVEGDPPPQVGKNLHDHLGAGEAPQEARLEGDDPGLGLEMENRLGGKFRPDGDARKFQERVEERFPEPEGEGEKGNGFRLRAALDHHVPTDGEHPDARHPAGRRVEQDLAANPLLPPLGEPLPGLLPGNHALPEVDRLEAGRVGVESGKDPADRPPGTHHQTQGESGHLLDDREPPVAKRVGHRHGHPVPFPGDRNDPVPAGQRFGKQVGEIEGNGVGLDLEKRNPERLRENPCARVGVQPVRKEGDLG